MTKVQYFPMIDLKHIGLTAVSIFAGVFVLAMIVHDEDVLRGQLMHVGFEDRPLLQTTSLKGVDSSMPSEVLCTKQDGCKRMLASLDAFGAPTLQKTIADSRYVPGQLLVRVKKQEPAPLFLRMFAKKQQPTDVLRKHIRFRGAKPLYNINKEQARKALVRQKVAKRRSSLDMSKVEKTLEETEEAIENSVLIVVGKNQDVEEVAQQLRDTGDVEWAHPNYVASVSYSPTDPYYFSRGNISDDHPNLDDLWGMKQNYLNAETAWNAGSQPMIGSEDVVVAVIDTGLDVHHEDAPNLWNNNDEIPNNGIDDDGNGFVDDVYGWDFVSNDAVPQDGNGHGSHVAGTIAAPDNGIGIVGVAPNVKIMPLRALDDAGGGTLQQLANALLYARLNGADVINNSWGVPFRTGALPLIEDEVLALHADDVVTVFAAGNSSDDVQYYGANGMSESIAVAAMDHEKRVTDFSNVGLRVDVVAPGDKILSLNANNGNSTIGGRVGAVGIGSSNQYIALRGTSMAAPHVAGVAALIRSAYPHYTNNQVAFALSNASRQLNEGEFGLLQEQGFLNANAALRQSPPDVFVGLRFNEENEDTMVDVKVAGVDVREYKLELIRHSELGQNPQILYSHTGQREDDYKTLPWRSGELELRNYVIRLTATTHEDQEISEYLFIDYANRAKIIPRHAFFHSSEFTFKFHRRYRGVAHPDDVYLYFDRSPENEFLEWKRVGDADTAWSSAGLEYGNYSVSHGTYNTRMQIPSTEEEIYEIRFKDVSDEVTVYAQMHVDPLVKDGWPKVFRHFDPGNILFQKKSHALAGQFAVHTNQKEIVTTYTNYPNRHSDLDNWHGSAALERSSPGGARTHRQEFQEQDLWGRSKVIVDLDGDGIDEIVTLFFEGNDDWTEVQNSIVGLNASGQELFRTELPESIPEDKIIFPMYAPLQAIDLNNDGSPEIIFRTLRRLYVLDSNGVMLPGWPQNISYVEDANTHLHYILGSTIAVGDVYNAPGSADDGHLEIITAENHTYTQDPQGSTMSMVARGINGQRLPAYPGIVHNVLFMRDIKAADIDGDGLDEPIVSIFKLNDLGTAWGQDLVVFEPNGTYRSIMVDTTGMQPAFITTDVDADGVTDVVYRGQWLGATAVNGNGEKLAEWVFDNFGAEFNNNYGQYVVFDIDNDGAQEIVTRYASTVQDGNLQATKSQFVVMNMNGTFETSHPLHMHPAPHIGGMHVDDIDGDGQMELVAGIDFMIYNEVRERYQDQLPGTIVYEVGGTNAVWPTEIGDLRNANKPVEIPVSSPQQEPEDTSGTDESAAGPELELEVPDVPELSPEELIFLSIWDLNLDGEITEDDRFIAYNVIGGHGPIHNYITPDSQRTAQEVEAYLDSFGMSLDISDDGVIDSYDANLVHHYIWGMGTSLIMHVTPPGSNRTEYDEILEYLQQLRPPDWVDPTPQPEPEDPIPHDEDDDDSALPDQGSFGAAPDVWDMDGNGLVEANDGLLAFFSVGESPAESLQPYLSDDAGRTVEQIQAYAETLRHAFDVDGDGDVLLETDGRLLFRYITGDRSESLIADAIGDNATRTTVDEIVAYLDAVQPQDPQQEDPLDPTDPVDPVDPVDPIDDSPGPPEDLKVWDVNGDKQVNPIDAWLVRYYIDGLRDDELEEHVYSEYRDVVGVQEYIQALEQSLADGFDVDLNGVVDPATDGLITYYYLRKLRDENLTHPVHLGEGAERTNHEEVIAYLDSAYPHGYDWSQDFEPEPEEPEPEWYVEHWDFDGNSLIRSNDGRLALDYVRGMRGNDLADSAADDTPLSPLQIQGNIERMYHGFDVDDSGAIEYVDGLLISGYLTWREDMLDYLQWHLYESPSGFSDASRRTDIPEIIAYLDSLTPLDIPDPDAWYSQTWDIDGNGRLDAKDAMMVYGYILGLTPEEVYEVAVDTPRTQQQVMDHFARLEHGFDVDGNGEVGQNTDGMIIFRYITNQHNDTLIASVGEGAIRTTYEEIFAYLDSIELQSINAGGLGAPTGATSPSDDTRPHLVPDIPGGDLRLR